MHNGTNTNMKGRHPRPAASFAARSKRWTSSAARPETNGSQNAQRNYERYLALAQAESQAGDRVAAENYSARRIFFQIDVFGKRNDIGEFSMPACGRALVSATLYYSSTFPQAVRSTLPPRSLNSPERYIWEPAF